MSTPIVHPGNDEAIAQLVADAGIVANHEVIERMVATSLGFGGDGASKLDLKISSAALDEMREAFRLFEAHTGVPKVTVFGSARTAHDDPLYQQAHDVTARLSERGWMAVTGAGPGIMEAAASGAGPDRALGVSIRLPFEELPSDSVTGSSHHVTMKYFFTRKLMLVKESSGFVCLPGGFGTLDEMFELLTLQQTGKAEPVPIVLLDRPGGSFWTRLQEFVEAELEGGRYISPGDFDRVLVTDSVDAAVAEITGFWRNYHSLRWVGDRLVIRLRRTPSDADLAGLNERFAAMLASGAIERAEPMRTERADGDALEQPRIRLTPARRRVGDLFRLIRAINELSTAPDLGTQETQTPG